MRDHIDFAAGYFEDLLQELGGELAHHDEAIRNLCDLFHHHKLIRIWFPKDGVQSSHDGHLQPAQQLQDVAPRRPAENSIFVLQADHVDIVKVQKLRSLLIRSQVVLGE